MDTKIFDLLVVFFAVLTLALSGIRARTEQREVEMIHVVQPNGPSPVSSPEQKAHRDEKTPRLGGSKL